MNITDFELKGLSALFEIANLTNHLPESFTLSKRKAQDVVSQISAFKKLGVNTLAAGGFVAAFMDLIDADEDVVYLLKSIDMRLTMLLKSSSNYTLVLPQWLGFLEPKLTCMNAYMDAIQRISNAVHKLYVYTSAKMNKEQPFIVSQKLEAFRQVCGNNLCGESTRILLSGINGGGDDIFKCDLVNILYQGVPG